jgi:hypothetical protein
MLYTVKYRLPNQWLWRKCNRVKGDETMPGGNRSLQFEDDTRLEIPREAVIQFSKERHVLILQNMEQEAGQKLPLKK